MPRDTSVILSEETASTGTGVSFFRCPLSEVGKQSQRLARVCPKWVSDCVLKVCLSNSSLIAMPRETIYFSNPGFVLPERCHQDELCAQLGEREEDSNPASWYVWTTMFPCLVLLYHIVILPSLSHTSQWTKTQRLQNLAGEEDHPLPLNQNKA